MQLFAPEDTETQALLKDDLKYELICLSQFTITAQLHALTAS